MYSSARFHQKAYNLAKQCKIYNDMTKNVNTVLLKSFGANVQNFTK
jgi:hypothetical protein